MSSERELGMLLAAWGALGVLALAAIVTLVSAPWFEGETWSAPSPNAPLAIVAYFGVASGALSIAAGVGLLGGRRWARPAATVACLISLLTVPIGTAIGIWGLVVLRRSRRPVT
jgi:hypothetical protein